jgi:D-alanyl-lipoteichoic acid acyltransferase DltB (MBOAT superfamily)
VFTPYILHVMRKAPAPGQLALHVLLAYFITFFLIGIWHGPTWTNVIGSVLFGLGAVVNQSFRSAMRARSPSDRVGAAGRALDDYTASVLTFSFVVVAMLPFWVAPDQLVSAVSLYGTDGLLVSIGLGTGIVAAILASLALTHLAAGFWSTPPIATRLRVLSTGSMIAATVTYLFLFPKFAYTFVYAAV